MATVAHPVFSDQTHYVTDDALQSWLDQGWTHVEGKDDDGPALSSFEANLLEQEKREVDGSTTADVSNSFQPNLTNDDIPEG